MLALCLQFALADIQDFQPEDIDRITSSLLDNLPNISNDDKKEMSQGMQQVRRPRPR